MVKKPKPPLTRGHNTLTESGYLQWIRSALRSRSLKWPPRAKALEAARRPYVGPNKLQKWQYKCAVCGEWYKAKEVAVDHIVPAGSILCVDDIGPFAERLFCETDGLRILCQSDHDIITMMDKQGITFEQARFEKAINEKMKLPAKELLAFLDGFGYNGAAVSNLTKRRVAVTTILSNT